MPGKLKMLPAMLVLTALLLQVFMPPIAAAQAIPLSTIKTAVKDAVDYLVRLERDGWISEYPGLPIVAYVWNSNLGRYEVYPVGSKSLVQEYFGSAACRYYGVIDNAVFTPGYPTITEYDVVFEKWCAPARAPWTVMKLHVRVERGYSYMHVKVDLIFGPATTVILKIGDDTVILSDASTPDTIYETVLYDTAIPSARVTAARHVNALAVFVFENLGLSYEATTIRSNVEAIFQTLFGDKTIRDFYNPLLADMPIRPTYIEPVNVWEFYDAKAFGSQLGYYIIYEQLFENKLRTPSYYYPRYPYKSKIVAASECTLGSGPELWIQGMIQTNDPLYHAVMGAYYLHIGDYQSALDHWNKIVQQWDGVGLGKSATAQAYSTVRLAAAVAFGSMLAGRGLIDWSTVDEMVNVLVQLQWKGYGHYAEEPGTPVYYIYMPDHRGGFITSYDKIASYGFVPYRAKLVEDLIDFALNICGWTMDPETAGPIPTNAEATILALIALVNYAYHRYGVPPSQLLS